MTVRHTFAVEVSPTFTAFLAFLEARRALKDDPAWCRAKWIGPTREALEGLPVAFVTGDLFVRIEPSKAEARAAYAGLCRYCGGCDLKDKLRP